VRRALPGDERVPDSNITTTMAVTIHAPAREVWPWMAQIGRSVAACTAMNYWRTSRAARCATPIALSLNGSDGRRSDAHGAPGSGYPVNQVVALERGRWLLMAGADFKTGIADPLPQPGNDLHQLRVAVVSG